MRNANRQWRLKRHPEGLPKESDWELVEAPIAEPGAGEVLVRSIYLDVAPYMRARISPMKNYARGVAPGEVMLGGGVGEVVRSNHPDWRPGDLAQHDFDFGWQDYPVLKGEGLRRVDPAVAPLPAWMGWYGVNGLTALFGLVDCGAVKAGDVVVVSAAAGSVGQLVGQIAKIRGARAVAVASTADKIVFCREQGFDDGIAYRDETDLPAALKRVCPDGVDLFFDNTGGPIHDAVLQNLVPRARVVICGTVSLADRLGQPDIGPRFLRQVLVARARIEGFLVLDYKDRYAEGFAQLAAWSREGRLRHREDILDGLERLPEAFLRLLTSRNLGKQLVRAAPEPAG
jgi:NADPH-dependent curcumin reductase CurA